MEAAFSFVEIACEFVQVLSELEQTLSSPGLGDLCRSDRVKHLTVECRLRPLLISSCRSEMIGAMSHKRLDLHVRERLVAAARIVRSHSHGNTVDLGKGRVNFSRLYVMLSRTDFGDGGVDSLSLGARLSLLW